MAMCEKCGAHLEEGMKYCDKCGSDVTVQSAEQTIANELKDLNDVEAVITPASGIIGRLEKLINAYTDMVTFYFPVVSNT